MANIVELPCLSPATNTGAVEATAAPQPHQRSKSFSVMKLWSIMKTHMEAAGSKILCSASNGKNYVRHLDERCSLSIWLSIGVFVIMGALAIKYAYDQQQLARASMQLAQWTARNDFIALCKEQTVSRPFVKNCNTFPFERR